MSGQPAIHQRIRFQALYTPATPWKLVTPKDAGLIFWKEVSKEGLVTGMKSSRGRLWVWIWVPVHEFLLCVRAHARARVCLREGVRVPAVYGVEFCTTHPRRPPKGSQVHYCCDHPNRRLTVGIGALLLLKIEGCCFFVICGNGIYTELTAVCIFFQLQSKNLGSGAHPHPKGHPNALVQTGTVSIWVCAALWV